MDKSGTECIRKASQIMNFNDSQKVKGVEILKILEETTVEEGIEIWSVKLTLVAVYGTQGQVQLLGGLQVRNRGESKRVPVQVRPPPT